MQKFFGKILLIFFLLSTCLIANINAQDTSFTIRYDTVFTKRTKVVRIVTLRTIPKFILHFNGGLNTGAMELTSHNGGFNKFNFLLGKNFGARNGFGFNLVGKLPLSKKGNFWLDVTTGFDHFQSNIFAENTDQGKVYYNSINTGVGIEYNFTPDHKVKYFIGLNPLFSFISGKSELTNPDNNHVDISIQSSLRIGYQAFIGFEYAFIKNFGLNAGIRFTHANLLLKKTEEPIEDESSIPPTTIVNLNDDATVEPVAFGGWKQFAYFSASVGFSYFFGVKEVKYKLPDR